MILEYPPEVEAKRIEVVTSLKKFVALSHDHSFTDRNPTTEWVQKRNLVWDNYSKLRDEFINQSNAFKKMKGLIQ